LDQIILPIEFRKIRAEVGRASVIEAEIEGLSPASAIQMRTTEQFYAASAERKTQDSDPSILQKLIRSGSEDRTWEQLKTTVEFRIAKSAIPVSWRNLRGDPEISITETDVDRAVFCLLLVPECLHGGKDHGEKEYNEYFFDHPIYHRDRRAKALQKLAVDSGFFAENKSYPFEERFVSAVKMMWKEEPQLAATLALFSSYVRSNAGREAAIEEPTKTFIKTLRKL